jgi:hypothetical protein
LSINENGPAIKIFVDFESFAPYFYAGQPENSGGSWWGNIPGVQSTDILSGPGDYTDVATILSVSGGVATSAGDSTNPDAVSISSSNYTLDSTGNYRYVDLSVAIPAGATSLLFDFGTDDVYGDATLINDIQASALPEPASLGLVAITSAGLLMRRKRNVIA